MGVSSISLSISCWENGVDKNKSSNDLSTKAIPLGVAMVHCIGSTTRTFKQSLFKAFHHACAANGTKALHHYVEYCSCQGKFPCKEETKCHCWVYVPTCPNPQEHKKVNTTESTIKQGIAAWVRKCLNSRIKFRNLSKICIFQNLNEIRIWFFIFFSFSPVDGNGLGLMGLSNQTRPLSPVGFAKDLGFFFFFFSLISTWIWPNYELKLLKYLLLIFFPKNYWKCLLMLNFVNCI